MCVEGASDGCPGGRAAGAGGPPCGPASSGAVPCCRREGDQVAQALTAAAGVRDRRPMCPPAWSCTAWQLSPAPSPAPRRAGCCQGCLPTGSCCSCRRRLAQVEVLLTFEEFCGEEGEFEGAGEAGVTFADIFPQVGGRRQAGRVGGEEGWGAGGGLEERWRRGGGGGLLAWCPAVHLRTAACWLRLRRAHAPAGCPLPVLQLLPLLRHRVVPPPPAADPCSPPPCCVARR